MIAKDHLEDWSCAPTVLRVDCDRLRAATDELVASTTSVGGPSYEAWTESQSTHGMAALNLTHHPSVEGIDRFFKYTGNRTALGSGWDERTFTTKPEEVTNSYIGDVLLAVEHYHLLKFKEPFYGRYQLIWIHPGRCYPLHTDNHTPHRYHVPIITNPECLWVFRNEDDLSLLHMPADGRVWYLDPIQQEHSVANLGRSTRLHLLMTTGGPSA